jgi:Ran GTPase-activating protein (RanGAP) involved in mRNA processing and transport
MSKRGRSPSPSGASATSAFAALIRSKASFPATGSLTLQFLLAQRDVTLGLVLSFLDVTEILRSFSPLDKAAHLFVRSECRAACLDLRWLPSALNIECSALNAMKVLLKTRDANGGIAGIPNDATGHPTHRVDGCSTITGVAVLPACDGGGGALDGFACVSELRCEAEFFQKVFMRDAHHLWRDGVTIRLHNFGITRWQDDWRHMADATASVGELALDLDLRNCQGARALAVSQLRKLPGLTALDLGGSGLSVRDLETLAAYISGGRQPQSQEEQQQQPLQQQPPPQQQQQPPPQPQQPQQQPPPPPQSGSATCRLTSLDLRCNALGCFSNLEQAAEASAAFGRLGTALAHAERLTCLGLSNVQLAPPDLAAFAMALPSRCALVDLNLSDNRLCGMYLRLETFVCETFHSIRWPKPLERSRAGTGALLASLHHCASLSSFDLSSSDLDDQSSDAALAVLQHSNIATFGTIPIRRLRDDPCLVELDLSGAAAGAAIGVHGAVVIGALLRTNRALTHLDLRRNEIARTSGWMRAGSEGLIGADGSVGDVCSHWGQPCVIARRKVDPASSDPPSSDPPSPTVVQLQYLAGVEALAAGFRANRVLTSVNLLQTALGVHGAQTIVAAFEQSRTLETLCGVRQAQTHLDLSSLSLGAGDAILIAADIKASCSLTTCNLLRNNFGTNVRVLTDAFAQQQQQQQQQQGALRSLCGIRPNQTEASFRNKSLRAEDAVLLAVELYHSQTLRKLDLVNSGVGLVAAVDGGLIPSIDGICSALKSNTTLQHLDIGSAHVGLEGSAAIIDMLSGNQTLTALDVCHSRLGTGSQPLADAVLRHASLQIFCGIPICGIRADQLTELELSGQGIGAHGAAVLAQLLASNDTITFLGLCNNNLGDQCTAIAHAALCHARLEVFCAIPMRTIRADAHMTALDLSNKSFNAHGALVLADLIKVHGTLTSLNIAGNGVGGAESSPIAFQRLGEALRQNNTLADLVLSSNGIKDMDIAPLAEHLGPTSLTSLNLCYNSIGHIGAKHISGALLHW